MNRPALCPLILFGTLAAGCGGAGLLATVPPPVEFAGARIGGIAELPAAGTYAGTLIVERVTLRYSSAAGEWQNVAIADVSPSTAATATIGADGTIELRRTGESTNLFTGTLKLTPATATTQASTTATLRAFDGTSALYPYYLKGTPRVLSLVLHPRATYASRTQVTFDRYSFDVTAP